MNKDSLLATGLLSGTIIGAGIFSLPYIVSRVGILTGFFYLIVFVSVYFAIHLMYANLIKNEKGKHQFFYFAEKYLSKKVGGFASFIILAELIFVLTVYLILAPTFAGLVFGKSGLAALLVFWFLGSIFVFARLTFLGWAEFLGTLSILAIVLIIFFAGSDFSLTTPLFKKIEWPLFFLPFGPLLFSIAGRPAISKVVEEYERARGSGRSFSLNKAIFWGTAVPAIVYALFIIGVLRLNPGVSPEALDSLNFLPPILLMFLGILGLLTLWTSYFIIGINVKDILRIDLKRSRFFSSLVVLAAPLILYFLGLKNFLAAVGFTGGIFLALEGIFVITMWRRAFPRNKWRHFSFPLYLIFAAALIYEIATFVL